MTITEALADVMADVRAVGKGDRNEQQGFSFRGIDAVVNAVGPILRKHGVIVMPDLQSVDYSSFTNSNNRLMHACRVVVAYVFTGPDGDSLTAKVAGEAFDTGDKATPKAMSVAFRTALLQALTLPTHEPDPDASSYETSPANVNTTTGEVQDAATALYDAMNATEDVEELRAIYRRFNVGSAPADVRAAFAARVDAVTTKETGQAVASGESEAANG